MRDSFKKYAAATALGLTVALPPAASFAQQLPPLPPEPILACEQAQSLGTLQECLTTTNTIASEITSALSSLPAERAYFNQNGAYNTTPYEYNLALQELDAIDSERSAYCSLAEDSAGRVNRNWDAALTRARARDLYKIPVTPELRQSVHDFIDANAYCMGNLTDTFRFLADQNRTYARGASVITDPLYQRIEQYRSFDSYRR